jgi:cytosine/adenosine deaminase-related metal-dependent hydrolase
VRLAGCVVALAACADAPASSTFADAPVAPVTNRQGLHDPHAGHTVAFVDVAVATMESPQLVQHQTVVVEGGNVVRLGPVSGIELAPDTERIDGKGKVLVPGLHDMHVHLDNTRGMLALFVGAGVTTVRNMAGSPRTLALRDKIDKGELLGPKIYTAGPFVDGERPRWEASMSVTTAADAERVVAEHLAVGYDFVKVYNGLSVEAYDALAAAAKPHHLRLVGHVPFKVPLDHALATEQASIEHLSGYAEAIERADSPVRHLRNSTGIIKRWMYADPARIAEVAAETARHGVWNTPTLVTAVAYSDLYRGQLPPTNADIDEVSPDWRARWDPKHSPKRYDTAIRHAMEQAHDKQLQTQFALVRALIADGAPLLAGTDTPNPYVVPGASLHQELALLVSAGLTPYAALRTATIDAAEFLGDPHDGRIAAGAHADLVLLDADPLADIHALDKIAGVMVRGRWLSANALRAMHDTLVTEYKTPAWETPIDLGDAHTAQYVVSDNGVPVGAYAVARKNGTIVERQTLEDETIAAREVVGGDHRARSLALDVERPESTTHATYGHSSRMLIGWLTPATALEIVEPLIIGVDEKVTFAIDTPDVDAPGTLQHGTLAITRVTEAETSEATKVYRLRLVLDHVAQVARLTVEGDGLPHAFKISSTTRPVVRTWRRR